MNPNDFESQLGRQPLRSLPPEWREELLSRAQASVPKPAAAPEPQWLAAGRLLLARIPTAWGALALLWLGIFGVNSLMSETTAPQAPAPAPMEPLSAWNLQRAEPGRLADLISTEAEGPPRPVAPAVPPSPRTDRRPDEHLGELGSGDKFTALG